MLLGVIFQPVPHQPEQAALPAISLTQHTLDCDDAVFPLNQGLLDCHRLVHAELSNPGVGQVGTSHSVLELLRGAPELSPVGLQDTSVPGQIKDYISQRPWRHRTDSQPASPSMPESDMDE